MPRQLAKSTKSKTVRKRQYPKKSRISVQSGAPHAEHGIQQQRYSKAGSVELSIPSKRGDEHLSTSRNDGLSGNYHPWNWEYHKIITRVKTIKPMTKDSYSSTARLVSHAVESVTTEEDCCCALIPGETVKVVRFKIQRPSRMSLPSIIRRVRLIELMPSERPAPSSTSMKTELLSQSQYKNSTISIMNTKKITSISSTSNVTDHSSNQTPIQSHASVIRRPSRKLVLNVSHETILPLSGCT